MENGKWKVENCATLQLSEFDSTLNIIISKYYELLVSGYCEP